MQMPLLTRMSCLLTNFVSLLVTALLLCGIAKALYTACSAGTCLLLNGCNSACRLADAASLTTLYIHMQSVQTLLRGPHLGCGGIAGAERWSASPHLHPAHSPPLPLGAGHPLQPQAVSMMLALCLPLACLCSLLSRYCTYLHAPMYGSFSTSNQLQGTAVLVRDPVWQGQHACPVSLGMCQGKSLYAGPGKC